MLNRHIKAAITEMLFFVNILLTTHGITMILVSTDTLRIRLYNFSIFSLIIYVKYAKSTIVYIRVGIKHMRKLMHFAIAGRTPVNTITTVTSPTGVLFLAVSFSLPSTNTVHGTWAIKHPHIAVEQGVFIAQPLIIPSTSGGAILSFGCNVTEFQYVCHATIWTQQDL